MSVVLEEVFDEPECVEGREYHKAFEEIEDEIIEATGAKENKN